MVVRSGVYIVLELLLLMMLVLHYSGCMSTTSESGPFAGLRKLLLIELGLLPLQVFWWRQTLQF